MAGPKKIVPLVTPETMAAAIAAAPARLTNHGGPVIGSVEVIPIFCGAHWGQSQGAALITQLEGFFDFFLTSSVMDLLAEFSTATTPIGHGSRQSSVTLTTSEPGSISGGVRSVSDEEIQRALQGWITAGNVPPTTANTLYFIYLPPNVVSTDGNSQSCVNYCGYHNHINGSIFYAVEPFITCPGCDFGSILDSLTKVSSHALCEAVTDPALSACWDSSTGNEIGDICNTSIARLGGFLVQTEWSNKQSACVLAPPS
jgi:hypothetical protein